MRTESGDNSARFLLTRPLRDVTQFTATRQQIFLISTHTPLAGRDFNQCIKSAENGGFLLTRPLRDVTISPMHPLESDLISTHTPLAGRDNDFNLIASRPLISTHTPLAGRDSIPRRIDIFHSKFLLTRPLRDVTAIISVLLQNSCISTHTPLAGRDGTFWTDIRIPDHFYSHAPCGT